MSFQKIQKNRKKGFVLTFLVGLLLTAIIFIPTCLFVSEFFRLSSQAKDNFSAFVNEFKTLGEDKEIAEGARKTALLILDDKTALVYFSSERMILNIYAQDDDVVKVEMARPSQCQLESQEWPKGCFCLVQDAVIEEKEGKEEIENLFTINPLKVICQKVNFEVVLEGKDCGFGASEEVKFYNCYDGFIIERGLFEANDISPNYKNERRIVLTLEKAVGGVVFSKNESQSREHGNIDLNIV